MRRGESSPPPSCGMLCAPATSPAPRLGIHAVEAGLPAADGAVTWWPGVASLGLRPTINPLPEPLLEVHLFDVAPDLYGKAKRVRLHTFLCDEARFETLGAVVEQMQRDAAEARAVLAGLVAVARGGSEIPQL